MPFLVIVGFGLLGAALYGMGAATRSSARPPAESAWPETSRVEYGLGRSTPTGGSAWARARGTSSTGAATETATALARLCAQTPELVSVDNPQISTWAECPGRSMRDLRVLAARLERAATDERTDTARRERLMNGHVALMDWIDRRDRERA
jgi:hypothetical protein